MTHENHKDFEFISNKVSDYVYGKLKRIDLIIELVKYTEQLRDSGVVRQSKQLLDFIQWRKQVSIDDLTDKEIVEFYLSRKVK